MNICDLDERQISGRQKTVGKFTATDVFDSNETSGLYVYVNTQFICRTGVRSISLFLLLLFFRYHYS